MPEPLDTSAPSPWLDRLVADHAGDLRRAARRLGFGASDVDDVVSATWETFLRVAGDFRGEAQVRTFLRGILRRKAAEFRRKARRAARPDDEVESTAWAGPDPEEQAGQTEARERLVECLGGLPPRERAAVTRRVLNDELGEEVARHLQVSAEHLRVLLHRARHRLFDCMHDAGHGA